jgi:hypothetical protein
MEQSSICCLVFEKSIIVVFLLNCFFGICITEHDSDVLPSYCLVSTSSLEKAANMRS